MSLPQTPSEWLQLEAEEAELERQRQDDLNNPLLDAENFTDWLCGECFDAGIPYSADVYRSLDKVSKHPETLEFYLNSELVVMLMTSQDQQATFRILEEIRSRYQDYCRDEPAVPQHAFNIMSTPMGSPASS